MQNGFVTNFRCGGKRREGEGLVDDGKFSGGRGWTFMVLYIFLLAFADCCRIAGREGMPDPKASMSSP